MKNIWQRPAAWPKRPLDPSVPTVARRFAVRLLIILPFAALPLPHASFLGMFVALTGFNAMFSFFAALLLRERPNAPVLNNYDEALGMAALCLIARLFI
jgi:hypothetical protein